MKKLSILVSVLCLSSTTTFARGLQPAPAPKSGTVVAPTAPGVAPGSGMVTPGMSSAPAVGRGTTPTLGVTQQDGKAVLTDAAAQALQKMRGLFCTVTQDKTNAQIATLDRATALGLIGNSCPVTLAEDAKQTKANPEAFTNYIALLDAMLAEFDAIGKKSSSELTVNERVRVLNAAAQVLARLLNASTDVALANLAATMNDCDLLARNTFTSDVFARAQGG